MKLREQKLLIYYQIETKVFLIIYNYNNYNKDLIIYIFYLEKGKIGTISGIKSYHEWTWPDQGEDIGFIYARILPEIGEWKKWSSTQLKKFKKNEYMKNQILNILLTQKRRI